MLGVIRASRTRGARASAQSVWAQLQLSLPGSAGPAAPIRLRYGSVHEQFRNRLWGNPRHKAGILSSNLPDPLRCSQSGGILAGGLGIAGPGDCCRGSVGKVPGAVRFGPLSMGTPAADCQAIRRRVCRERGEETPGRACARELSLAQDGEPVKQSGRALCLTVSQPGTGVWLYCTWPGL